MEPAHKSMPEGQGMARWHRGLRHCGETAKQGCRQDRPDNGCAPNSILAWRVETVVALTTGTRSRRADPRGRDVFRERL